MITIRNKNLRNLEEQVQYLTDYHDVNQGLVQWGIRVVGQVENESELPEPYDGEYGDAIAVGTSAPYFFYIWTRASIEGNPAYWFPFGQISIVGPQGPQGIQGPVGPTGESSKWYAGSELPPAVSSNYIEGDMYLNTSVGLVFRFQNGGWNPMVNIQGPQGIQGVRGIQGPQGDRGEVGPQGPRGYNGGFVNVIGTVPTTSALPDPETINNLTYAYLVGTAEPYALYVQVGDNPVTAQWYNMGTAANTEGFVHTTSLQNKVYVHDHEKDTTIGYTSAVQGGSFIIRGWDGEVAAPASQKVGNYFASASYVDSKAPIYQHKVLVRNSAGALLTFCFLCKFKATAFSDIEDLKSYLTLPSVMGIYPATLQTGDTSTLKSAVVMSALDGGTGTLVLQTVTNDGSQLFIANQLQSDDCIEL